MGVSVVNTGCFIGTAMTQPLFGYIAELTWDGTMANGVRIYSANDYHNGFIAMIIFSIIALAAAFKVRERSEKPFAGTVLKGRIFLDVNDYIF